MKKKQYETLAINIVCVQQQAHLLAQSLEGNTNINVEYEEEDW